MLAKRNKTFSFEAHNPPYAKLRAEIACILKLCRLGVLECEG